ncbi:MAG: hypothetical protein NZO58_06260 [Gemmataceae bacterium]|nr:hypothetical protein [Gemmataceae bacterium]
MCRKASSLCLALATLAAVGCGQPLRIEKTVTLEAGDVAAPALVEAPKAAQKIKVEFASSNSPVSVYVVLGKDAEPILAALGREPVKGIDIVAKKEKSTGDSFDASIPAGKDYGIYLSGAMKKTEVKLKISTP